MLNIGPVDENVRAAIVWLDKTVALFGIEPLHRASSVSSDYRTVSHRTPPCYLPPARAGKGRIQPLIESYKLMYDRR